MEDSVAAVLGPTNTGKTHYALERMVAHGNGVIGLPLRLLAREVYQRLVERVGEHRVALVTGEESIKPFQPDFWVATAEAMPLDLDLSFAAIDEIQLATDLKRGHVFTDRLLNFRGSGETLLLGSETLRPAIEDLLPKAEVRLRSRFSKLTYSGACRLDRLPPRTAIIAFTTDEVYTLAEMVRRVHGGAAVVLGALSPRTRNAQVDLYQSGQVDYVVATDAIGMGLNLDIDHVAFAALEKFDGFQARALSVPELAQIAGRAGRYRRPGTFGVTGRMAPLDKSVARAIEGHHFPPDQVLQWRNTELDFSSLESLQASLDLFSNHERLARALPGDNLRAFRALAPREAIRAKTEHSDGVELLWKTCQIPDYCQLSPEAHIDLVETVFESLSTKGKLSEEWYEKQLRRCEKVGQDLAHLSARVKDIRTWAYLANREGWLDDREQWQHRAREIEDALSDALHASLLERFVDREGTKLRRLLMEPPSKVPLALEEDGTLHLGDVELGRFQGLCFEPEAGHAQRLGASGRATHARARAHRVAQFQNASDEALSLSPSGMILWDDAPVAKLKAGRDVLSPQFQTLADAMLSHQQVEGVRARIKSWIDLAIRKHLQKLVNLSGDIEMAPQMRALLLELRSGLGVIARARLKRIVHKISREQIADLRSLGVRIAARHVYMRAELKPHARHLALALAAAVGALDEKLLPGLHTMIFSGLMTNRRDPTLPKSAYLLAGYACVAQTVIRVDIMDRLFGLIRRARLARDDTSTFQITEDMLALTGSDHAKMIALLQALGYVSDEQSAPPGDEDSSSFHLVWREAPRRPPNSAPRKNRGKRADSPALSTPKPHQHRVRKSKKARHADESPFAVLATLKAKKAKPS